MEAQSDTSLWEDVKKARQKMAALERNKSAMIPRFELGTLSTEVRHLAIRSSALLKGPKWKIYYYSERVWN